MVVDWLSSGFQSTLPVGGATSPGVVVWPVHVLVSIHAPRGRSDPEGFDLDSARHTGFNPRSPWEERRPQQWGHCGSTGPCFNPRSPWEERHPTKNEGRAAPGFNPRSPWEERLFVGHIPIPHIHSFNPRSPWEERRTLAIMPVVNMSFNPRSPWEERLGVCHGPPGDRRFNPRSPWEERPLCIFQIPKSGHVSIHAPRGRSDVAANAPSID